MKAIAKNAVCAAYGKIDPNRFSNSFELFGLDFMIDANFKVIIMAF